MGFRQAGVHFECLQCQSLRLAATFIRGDKTPKTEYGQAIGQACIGRSIGLISCNHFLEVLDCFSESFSAASVPIVTTFQIGLVRFRVHRACSGQSFPVTRRECDLNFPRNGLGYFRLQRQYISQVAVVILGPQMPVRMCVNELRRNPHSPAGAHDRAFHDPIHAQLAS